ncbi:DNA cytosine methyltransferase [Flavobacterium sp. J27]|uniref:DNA cytosine methyltransferase n=1 Tax=Flavobacterium sp. J27 TaxID=2060419 RepID=UPI001031F9C7|nr:DNA cytosine methyltransferase [Flavobacterium sp. J27]
MKIYWIDLFCGAGGTSTGIQFSNTNSTVLACVNHDVNAIASHELNHPKTIHFTEDIRDFRVVEKLKVIVDEVRQKEPTAIINLWASLECTNFSKAKGGQSRDADSRTLAEHMFMYLKAISPDYFYVENVREFMSWGPLDKMGKPISKENGKDYEKWVNRVISYDYYYDYKLFNAADFGAYQSRERLFIQFAKNDLPISWPKQTHVKENKLKKTAGLKRWKPVKEVLQLENEGESIFNRKKNLSENTLKRIYAGLLKFVANGENTFTKRYNGGKVNPEQKVNSLNKPMGTILTNCTHAIVKSVFIKKYFSGRPMGKVISINEPAGTITTVGGQAIVSAAHLSTYYKNFGLHSIENPSPTITTKDRVTKIDVNFLDEQYGKGSARSIDLPAGAITTVPKFNFVKIKAANYILNPSWGGNNSSIEKPCCTIVARQDKAPLYLVKINEEPCFLMEIQNFFNSHDYTFLEDLENNTFGPHLEKSIRVKIVEFMFLHGISDIKMRMLNIDELKQIQGFPKDYKLIGTKTQQKKYIGNAVEVGQATVIVESNYNALLSQISA